MEEGRAVVGSEVGEGEVGVGFVVLDGLEF